MRYFFLCICFFIQAAFASVDSSAHASTREGDGFARNLARLQTLADSGNRDAQDFLAFVRAPGSGVTEDTGFSVLNNLNLVRPLEALADSGNYIAQSILASVFAGQYGSAPNPARLEALADAGNTHAQSILADGLARGTSGFTQDLARLQALADSGNLDAQDFLAHGFALGWDGFTGGTARLEELAASGNKGAKEYLYEGLAHGWHGFTQDLVRLQALADSGDLRAQFTIALGDKPSADIAADPRLLDLYRKAYGHDPFPTLEFSWSPPRDDFECILWNLYQRTRSK